MLEQWIIAVLLTVFHPELSESSLDSCLDKGGKRQIKRVDENATAFVSCPKIAENTTLSVAISLYKGDTKLHSTDMMNNTHQSWQKFQVSKQSSSVSYKILRTEANDTGLYNCTIHTGMNGNERTSQTILLVKDAQQPREPSPCPDKQTLPLSISCGLLTVYNLFITISLCYFAHKLKKEESPEHAYMNTRPGGFRRR